MSYFAKEFIVLQLTTLFYIKKDNTRTAPNNYCNEVFEGHLKQVYQQELPQGTDATIFYVENFHLIPF